MSPENNSHKKALVVDDEPIICKVCKRTLILEGFEVDIAIDGLIAKKMLATNEYDLCLSDIRIPCMDGIELFGYIKQEKPGLLSKLIFMTGDVLSNNIDLFLKQANRPFLSKPFSPEEFRKIIIQISNSQHVPVLSGGRQ